MNSTILNELRRIVGDRYVMSEKEDLIIYASDSTMFDYCPDAVVQPATREEVVAIVKLAARNNIPVTGRGAGTCLSGGAIALKGGIIVDMVRMNRIRSIDAANKVAVVEPGVITFELASQAAKQGLLYPPDPSSWKESTLGGNVAECAGGPKGVKYGITRNFVLSLEVVLPNGQVVETGNAVDGDMCGPDWTMLLTGSEGTLGLITAITLRLVSAPITKKTMLAIYERLEDAAKTVSVTMASGIIPTTLELMDNMAIVATEKALKIGLPVHAGGLLLIEVDGVPSTVEENAKRISEICQECGVMEFKIAQTAAEAEKLWAARRGIAKAFGQIAPCKYAEDATVPRSLVPVLVEKSMEIAKKHNIPILICGHAGDGNMHPTILFDKRDKAAFARAEKALADVHIVTLELGGTLSGEHGIGFAKAPYLRAEVGPVGYKLGQDVKAVIDPENFMNPGKMFNYEGELH
ncbi:Glycolate oxidase subunit GlcD [uncultured Sporomusa sp.]|uniref:Glycolate oxidase subunit GlcD n=1 Tax=uncultured Sporomusa sp. TaxID=307249 RepID=A0A212LT76_9FIRM|nr:FAD-linked oxidase C-terminal domain-containing protein [uncultured Sporomusa sp.]SCM80768.1 Glycolate oxidase subunit GlcD [uncultured Sporomusa sp.]